MPTELVADCPPAFDYAARGVTVRDLVERIGALEDALAICRHSLAQLRRLSNEGTTSGLRESDESITANAPQ